MFLNEIALGNEHHITMDDWRLVAPPKGYDSIVDLFLFKKLYVLRNSDHHLANIFGELLLLGLEGIIDPIRLHKDDPQ